ncbi:zinc-ribbon domain-containing protein, partial [Escherichia albertii]|nr:zinc-ribbon domain-containing protein [Escherichia albertii]
MELSCPICQNTLDISGNTAHCAVCDKNFTVQPLCPDCHKPLQVLKACG